MDFEEISLSHPVVFSYSEKEYYISSFLPAVS